jgi:hypothetical protein
MMAPTRAIALLSVWACSDFSLNDKDEFAATGVVVDETFLQEPTPMVDLLWLVDNTASMAAEHSYLDAHTSTFIDRLNAQQVSWHLGAITPDGEGVLEGNPWVITQDNATDATLSAMLNPGVEGAQPATGLFALNLALSPSMLQEDNRGFRRKNAGLHVVIFSDGDDQSDGLLDGDGISQTLLMLADIAESSGQIVAVSAIVGPGPAGCTGVAGAATPGIRYAALAVETGGSVASICEPNFEAIADHVAAMSIQLSTAFSLQAIPKPDTARVSVDGLRADAGWSISGNILHFEIAPPFGATIAIRYTAQAL